MEGKWTLQIKFELGCWLQNCVVWSIYWNYHRSFRVDTSFSWREEVWMIYHIFLHNPMIIRTRNVPVLTKCIEATALISLKFWSSRCLSHKIPFDNKIFFFFFLKSDVFNQNTLNPGTISSAKTPHKKKNLDRKSVV